MKATVDFLSVVDAVVERRFAVDSGPGVEPWPALAGTDSPGVVTIWCHRDFPGAVAVAGECRGQSFLTGCYSYRLLAYLSAHRAELFNFEFVPPPHEAVSRLFAVLIAAVNGRESDQSAFRVVEGAEGAELLSELKRVAAEDAPKGALN